MGFTLFGKKKEKKPDYALPPGWQFYSRPNNLEKPGTIFRIDSKGTKYRVEKLRPEVEISPEPGLREISAIETKVGILARFLNLESFKAKASAGNVKMLEFTIIDPIRYSTTDTQIDKVLQPYLKEMEFKEKNKYYIIRDTRTAVAMKYILSDEIYGEIGGEASLNEIVNTELKLSGNKSGIKELYQKFPERLGIMFLPEEIGPISQDLANNKEPSLGRIPVRNVLDWIELEE